ncbi:MAG: TIGR04283 family arsenosugar biosynthesis glycosyltransferase [Acidiferrobacterales bacterium]
MSENADHKPAPTIGIVMPVLNEAAGIEQCLAELTQRQVFQEVIVVDGGSQDPTLDIVREFTSRHDMRNGPVFRLLEAPIGRASQMNAGACEASSDILLFLHADTTLPSEAAERVRWAVTRGSLWGRFDVRLDDRRVLFRIVERLMNWRSALTGIATGDQAIFVRRDFFERLGGYARVRLMEDIELSRRLKVLQRPARVRDTVTTSTRRWRKNGVVRTVLLMWWLRLLYWLGASPDWLARFYRGRK